MLLRSGTVVKWSVEYRSLPAGEDMPRKPLDTRFPEHPFAWERALPFPCFPCRTGTIQLSLCCLFSTISAFIDYFAVIRLILCLRFTTDYGFINHLTLSFSSNVFSSISVSLPLSYAALSLPNRQLQFIGKAFRKGQLQVDVFAALESRLLLFPNKKDTTSVSEIVSFHPFVSSFFLYFTMPSRPGSADPVPAGLH